MISRLESFAQPFVASLPSPESRRHSRTYLAGLLSDLDRKNAEAIAYRYDLDRRPSSISSARWPGTTTPSSTS